MATLDSDDLWLPGELERQLAAAAHDVVLGWHSWLRQTSRGAPSPLNPEAMTVYPWRR
jgi:glycosyltransferase involved in cell wall biosynthesis